MRIEEVELKNEQELEYLLRKNPEQIEKGLKVIANQVITPKGRIDLLCVDEEGVLTIVELKLDQDDDHLKQAINYFDWVLENMDWIINAYSKFKISDEYRPKVILIAKSFTESVITGAKYFAESFDIKLYEYRALKINEEKFIICKEVPIPMIPETPEKPKTIDDHLNYIKDDKVREVFNEAIEIIKSLSEDVEVVPLKWDIGFKFKGRSFAYISPRREAFVISWKQSDGWHYETNIKRITRVKELIEEKIKKSFELVGGKLRENKSKR